MVVLVGFKPYPTSTTMTPTGFLQYFDAVDLVI